MQIKTFVESSEEALDFAVNEFESSPNVEVKATQTCVGYNSDGLPITFRATCFFKDKLEIKLNDKQKKAQDNNDKLFTGKSEEFDENVDI